MFISHSYITLYLFFKTLKYLYYMNDDIIKRIIKETTSDRFAAWYNGPLTMGEIDWEDSSLVPFTKKVSDFYNAELQYDSYDGSLDSHKKERKKMESKSKKISKYHKTHPQQNDEDGGIINQTPGKGKKIVPLDEWYELDKIPLNEDLAVWFGTKKKPKGSKQPKGPWVNICKKVDGKLNAIHSYGTTFAYLKGTIMNLNGYTWIKPHPKYGTFGYNVGVITLMMPKMNGGGYDVSLSASAVGFWMKPYQYNRKVTLTPQVFLMQSPIAWNTMTGNSSVSRTPGAIVGLGYDYKISRRFALSTSYRGAMTFEPNFKLLNNFQIGSKLAF